MIIQFIIIVVVLIIGIWLTKARKNTRVRAWQKILFIFFILSVIILTLLPENALKFAKLVGLGRVTDLIVYGTSIFVSFIVVNIYLKFQEIELKIAKIVRETAIQRALSEKTDWRNRE